MVDRIFANSPDRPPVACSPSSARYVSSRYLKTTTSYLSIATQVLFRSFSLHLVDFRNASMISMVAENS